jgi:hypothetical protein
MQRGGSAPLILELTAGADVELALSPAPRNIFRDLLRMRSETRLLSVSHA